MAYHGICNLFFLTINNWMTLEDILNKLSMIALLAGGVYFIYEGASYIALRNNDPKKYPEKMVVAGSFTIVLGIVSIGFGIWHFFI
jgi:hypothetical protein